MFNIVEAFLAYLQAMQTISWVLFRIFIKPKIKKRFKKLIIWWCMPSLEI